MTESTKTEPIEVLYNSINQQVTIRYNGATIVLPLQDALWLGQQLYDLLSPAYLRAIP
jgi:hypothetical protein